MAPPLTLSFAGSAPVVFSHAVADLAGAGGGELAVFRDQLDALDAVEADIEADAFIDIVDVDRAIGAGDLQRNDLVREFAALGCRDGALMAVIGKLVEFILR